MSGGNESTPIIPNIVQITIRCALQAVEDQTIEASTIWTVKQLKDQIAAEHPSHPNPSTIKLIYGGHCLQDEQVLKNIFEVNPPVVDGPTVFLLVRPSPLSEPQQLRQRTNTRNPSSQQHQLPTYEEYLQSDTGSNVNYMDYYRNYINFYQAYGQNFAPPSSAAGQDYLEYYRNLINYYNSQGNQFFGAPNSFPHAVYINNGAGIPLMPYYVNPGQAQPVNLTGANRPPIVVNAAIFPQGPQNARPPQIPVAERRLGMVENGLELFYRAIRILFVLCAVMLYSSVERLILVIAIVLIIFATQYRRAEIRRAAANAAPINNNNHGEPAENRPAPDGDESTERAREENVEEAVVQPPPVSTLQTVISAVLSFFSSLIPEHIPVEVA